jgi:hypothetical protein
MSGSLQPLQSASQTVTGTAVAAMPTGCGYYPAEGSRVVNAIYNWATQAGYGEDLSQLVTLGLESSIQSVYIDNSQNTNAVQLIVPTSGQTINCTPYSQGIFPIFFSGTPFLQIVSQKTTSLQCTRVSYLNFPVSTAGLWLAGSPGTIQGDAPMANGGFTRTTNISSSTNVKAGAGRLAKITVVVAIAGGTVTMADTGAGPGSATASNTFYQLPTPGNVGDIYSLDFPLINGLSVVFTGVTAGTIFLSYT